MAGQYPAPIGVTAGVPLPLPPSLALPVSYSVKVRRRLGEIISHGFDGTALEGSIVERAARFAYDKHRQQTRKGSGLPYFVHLVEVAVSLAWASQDREVITAGFLHDVVEDQGVSRQELALLFGTRVARIVDEVTNVAKPEDGNRVARMALEREHLSRASVEAKNLKLADLTSNTRSIVVDQPKFAPVYLEEKRLLLPLLKEGSHPVLYQVASWAAGL